MSKYTTEVRFVCEFYSGLKESVGYDSVDDVIEKSHSKVFDFKYPIFDEKYRALLESKILKHYYTREICSETVGLWKLMLNRRMNEIMPYYNQLYESELLKFNPFYDVDLYTKRDVDTTGNSKSVGNATGKTTDRNNTDSWNYYSDTPQGGITGLENHTYLTNATHDTREYNGESNNIASNTNKNDFASVEDYLEHVYGKRGGVSYSKLLKEYRKTFLNIDLMIIDELSDLFFNLW